MPPRRYQPIPLPRLNLRFIRSNGASCSKRFERLERVERLEPMVLFPKMFCPHSRIEGLAVDQDAIGSGSNAFHPTDKTPLTGMRIDFVTPSLTFAPYVDGV